MLNAHIIHVRLLGCVCVCVWQGTLDCCKRPLPSGKATAMKDVHGLQQHLCGWYVCNIEGF